MCAFIFPVDPGRQRPSERTGGKPCPLRILPRSLQEQDLLLSWPWHSLLILDWGTFHMIIPIYLNLCLHCQPLSKWKLFLNLHLHFWHSALCLVQRRYSLNVFGWINDEKHCISKWSVCWGRNQYSWNNVDGLQNSSMLAALEFLHESPCHSVKIKTTSAHVQQ